MLQKQNARHSKEKIDSYGPERSHWLYALRLAWQDYYHLSQQQVLDKKRVQHYKPTCSVHSIGFIITKQSCSSDKSLDKAEQTNTNIHNK